MFTVFEYRNSIFCLFRSLADLAEGRHGTLIYLFSNLWTPIMQYSSWGQIYLPSWCQMALILHSGAQPVKQNCKEPMSLTYGPTQVQRPRTMFVKDFNFNPLTTSSESCSDQVEIFRTASVSEKRTIYFCIYFLLSKERK